jgi:hypothetical protein
MQESYGKGLAIHAGHESCLDDPRGRGEALTVVRTGGLMSSEITLTGDVATVVVVSEQVTEKIWP